MGLFPLPVFASIQPQTLLVLRSPMGEEGNLACGVEAESDLWGRSSKSGAPSPKP